MNTGEYTTLHIFSVLHLVIAVTAVTNRTVVLAVTDDTNGTEWTEDAVTNVALRKETLQSHLTQLDSNVVVDGNTDQYVANDSCINIEKKGNSWWQVDLGDIYTIFHIRVYLAKDCCDDFALEEEDCYTTPSTYRGKSSRTVNGRTCKYWDNIYPYNHWNYFFLRGNNYCSGVIRIHQLGNKHLYLGRKVEKPWCFTTDPNVAWEYCDVEQCEKVTTDDLNLKTGTQEKAMGIPHYIDITDHLRHVRDLFLPSNSRARYVELHQDGTADYYPLCEVEVYGIQDEATNVALRKTSQMSSINSENLFDQSLAVDGITEQNMLKGSCFYTAEEDNPWWRVDLAGYDTHDVLLKVGTSLGTMINASEVAGQIEDIQNIYLPINTEARFIELIRKGWGVFHLCEVEVFGKIAVCKFDPCQNGGNCSVIHCDDLDNCRNYTCACADGFGGVDCESCTYNVAVGKQIEASSIHHKSWQPSNVIDGDTNQNVLLGATCFSTQKEIKPYVMLDLGDEYNLTGVNVYKRLDCCEEDNYAIELFLMMTTWTSYGYTDGPVERIAEFGIYPYVATKYVKLEAKEQRPTFLQLCEIEVFSICEEDITTTTSTVSETMAEQSVPLIQMRFLLSDKYSDVVKSEKLFKKLIRHGLSSQTGYSEESFRNIQLEKEPFRVSFELHASDRKRTSLNEMLEKIETLNRFGILDIENEDGQLLAITAGSLQYHLLFVENKGTRIEKTILVAVSIIVTAMRYM